MTYEFSALTAALTTILLPNVVIAQDPAKTSASAIISELSMRDKCLCALSLVYQQIPRDGDVGISRGYVRRVVAARAPNWFMRDNGHGHERLNWTDDPFRKTLIIGPEGWKLLAHLNRVVETGVRPVGREAPFNIAEELIFIALCWWPYEDWDSPEVFSRRWSMRSLLRDYPYVLRDEVGFVDGRSCFILELPNVDVLWLDTEQPSCVLRRDVYNTTSLSVAMRYEFGDYYQYGPHIWLPRKIRNIQFDSFAHTNSLRQRRVIDSTFAVSEVAVNGDLNADVFKLDLPPGTVRNVSIASGKQIEVVREGQQEHIASIIDWGQRMCGNSEVGGHEFNYRDVFAFLFGFIIFWLLHTAFLRHRGKR